MMSCASRLAVTIVLAAGVSSLATVAPALPVADALAIRNAVPATVENVQWRRWGWGVGAGVVAGAIIGGAIANSAYPYGYYPYGGYYAPGPYAYPYYAPPPAYYGPPGPGYGGAPGYGGTAPVAGDAVAYCQKRYRSYDPASGTFLGNDGQRHPCP